jgi:cation:H+ antiporter
MVWDLLLVGCGILALFFGGEGLVRGAVALADRFAVPRAVVGVVIVGCGTSAPELAASLDAALTGAPEIAVGNVLGSNVANLLLILPLAAVLRPLAGADGEIRRDALVMTGSMAVIVGLVAAGLLGRTSGLLLLVGFAVYLVAILRSLHGRDGVYAQEAEELADLALSPAGALLAVVFGLGLLLGGAHLLVDGAVALARDLGVSEALIGVTLVAVGTSLPELATALVAALRRHGDVVLGNVIGSNIFNGLAILGAVAMVAPVEAVGRFAWLDAPAGLFAALLLLALLRARAIGRAPAWALLGLYGLYLMLAVRAG